MQSVGIIQGLLMLGQVLFMSSDNYICSLNLIYFSEALSGIILK
jgi:hypothetical protein